jgi:hypothetical protein
MFYSFLLHKDLHPPLFLPFHHSHLTQCYTIFTVDAVSLVTVCKWFSKQCKYFILKHDQNKNSVHILMLVNGKCWKTKFLTKIFKDVSQKKKFMNKSVLNMWKSLKKIFFFKCPELKLSNIKIFSIVRGIFTWLFFLKCIMKLTYSRYY